MIFTNPFYDIDYTLSLLVALQIYFKSLVDYDESFTQYDKFISYGGTLSFVKLCEVAKLKTPFSESFIDEMIDNIKKYL